MDILKILAFFCFIICSSGCASTFGVANAAFSSGKAVKGAKNRKKAAEISKDSVLIDDNINYATYYLYRKGSFVGVAASCLLYDNNNYIGVINNKTFEKVENVVPGEHIFTSKENDKHQVSINIEEGKTYIIQVKQSYRIRKGEMSIMNEEMIKREMKKKQHFADKIKEHNIEIENLSFK